MVTVRFTEPNVGNNAVYTICVDGAPVANVYGPMSAIASEAICRYLETPKGKRKEISICDIFERKER